MVYAILAIVFVLIGVLDIAPLVEWVDDRNFPMALKSALMLGILGGVPALILGVAIIGDTIWGRGSR